MFTFSVTGRIATISLITLLLFQIFSFSLPLLVNNNQIIDSLELNTDIPKSVEKIELESITESSSFKTNSYGGPPDQSTNSELDTITISSDIEFASTAVTQGWEGSGKQYDPFFIKNINFTLGDSINRLKIQDTTSHFIIQNCVFADADNVTVLLNVTNGVIKENIIEGAIEYGLYIDAECQNIRVIHNAFVNTPSGGINVYNNNSVTNIFRYNYFDDYTNSTMPLGGVYWDSDPYLLNGTGTDPDPRVSIAHFNVDDIEISTDSGLDTKAYNLGWDGNGSKNNPYLITNYNFSFVYEMPLLQIIDTSKFISIKNCFFDGGSNLPGIYTYSSSNIQIINSSFENCDTGLILTSSNGINVTKTTIINSVNEGFDLDTCHNLRIFDCEINNTGTNGLWSTNVNNSIINMVQIFNASHNGIYLRYNKDITVANCHMENITYRGLFIQDSEDITANGCFIQNSFATNSGGIRTDRASYITINNTRIQNISRHAIYLYSTSNSSVDFTNASYNYIGLNTYRVDDCNITRSNFWNSSYNGVYVDSACSNNIFAFLKVFNCTTGIQLVHADDNQILHNIVYYNNRGIHLWGQEGSIEKNIVSGNALFSNREHGIYDQWGERNTYTLNTIDNNGYEHNYHGIEFSDWSSNNTIVENYFFNNIAWDSGSNNSWNNATHGNYWEDYSGVDLVAPYGIGDSPYLISGPANSTDNFPLILGVVEVTINLLSPSNTSVIKSSTPLNLLIEGCSEFTYNWNDVTNYTQPVDTILSFPTEDGPYNLTLYATSGSGGWVIEKFLFIVDNTPPVMSPWDELVDGSEVGTGTTIPFSVIDVNFENFWYYWNNSEEVLPLVHTKIPWVDAPLNTGYWTLNVFGNDTAGNLESQSIGLSAASTDISQIYPNGGEIEGGFVTVSWISSENLSYNLFYSPDSGFSWILLVRNLEQTNFIWDTSSDTLNQTTFLVRVVSVTPGKPGEIRSDTDFTLLNIIRKFLPEGTTEIDMPDIHISVTVSDDTFVTIQRLTNVISMMDPNESGVIGYGLYVDINLDNQDVLEIITIEFDVSEYWDMIQAQGLDLYDINVYFFNETSNQWEIADETNRNLVLKIVIGTFDHTTTIGALGKTRDPSPGGDFGLFFLLIILVVGSVSAGALLVYEHQQKLLQGEMSIYTKIREVLGSTYKNVKERFNKNE